jgi:hypothetical protein
MPANAWKRSPLATGGVFAALALALVLASPSAVFADETEAEPANTPPASHEGGHVMAAAGHSMPDAPQLQLHGFSDVTLRSRWTNEGGVRLNESGAGLGQFDLFISSQIRDRISFMGETVFELGADGGALIDVERLSIRYAWSDAFRLTVGRTHTALGYWNEAFHHGALLQPSVERPHALRFEDDGGILPVHAVGLEFTGELPVGRNSIAYAANVANGRGRIVDVVQGQDDLNQDKAVSLKLSFVMDGAGTLVVGPAFYRDLIPGDPATPGRESAIHEWIPGAHLAWRSDGFDLFSEAFEVLHRDAGTRLDYRHRTAYVVAALHRGAWSPYAGVDAIDFQPGDPFFASMDADVWAGFGGLRYDFGPYATVRFEFRHENVGQGGSNGLALQSAFAF